MTTIEFSLETPRTDAFKGLNFICGPEHIRLVLHEGYLKFYHNVGDTVYAIERFNVDDTTSAVLHFNAAVLASCINEQQNANFEV